MWIKSKCPESVPSYGEEHEFDFCINECKHPCIPRPVIYNITKEDQLYEERKHHAQKYNKSDKIRISVTSLLYCLRKHYYDLIYDFAEEPPKRWSLYRGIAVHSMLEPVDKNLKEYLDENKFIRTIEDIELVGRVDYIDFRLCEIGDHKSIKNEGINMRIKEGASKEHEEQINVYRWLVSEKYPEVWNFKMKINYVSMGRIISTGNIAAIETWRKDEPKDKGILKKTKTSKTRGNQTKWLLYYKVPKIKRWRLSTIESFVIKKSNIIKKAILHDIIPPMIGKDKQKWMCPLCQFQKQCSEYEQIDTLI